jgi:carbon storage regulator
MSVAEVGRSSTRRAVIFCPPNGVTKGARMLVITRKAGEAIRIGDDVTITVLDVAGSTVRIGIDAPSEIPVFRQEIWAAVKEENRAAADASVEDVPGSESS